MRLYANTAEDGIAGGDDTVCDQSNPQLAGAGLASWTVCIRFPHRALPNAQENLGTIRATYRVGTCSDRLLVLPTGIWDQAELSVHAETVGPNVWSTIQYQGWVLWW
jgi:hypothetical protein